MDDLRQLRHLVALGSHSTLADAAESLGITKSALSQSIKRIEDIYGVSLFARGRRGLQITVYGELLVESARQGIEIFTHTRRQLELIQNLETGRIIIGCDPLMAEALLSRVLVRALQLFPKLRYELKSGFWPDMQKSLESGEIDFFVGIKPDISITEFEVAEITLPGIIIYCRHGHPLTLKGKVVLDDVYAYPIIGPLMPEWFYAEMDKYLASTSGRQSPRGRLFFLLTNDEGTSREIVKNTDAISGCFYPLIQSDVEAGRLAVLPIFTAPFDRPVPCLIVSHQKRVLPPAAMAVVQTVKDVAQKLVNDTVTFSH